MRMMLILFSLVMLVFLSGCSTVAPDKVRTEQVDSGYFLSMRQKGQLLWKGRIQDEAGIWYDIWIVPGYVTPAQQAGTFLRKTCSDFAEYVDRRKYQKIANNGGDVLRFAYDECLVDFTVKGASRAWGRNWSKASDRTSKRVFGWWFAYPWAIMEGTVDNAVRIPAGMTGTLLCTVVGVAVVPGYYTFNSTVAGGWHFAGRSVTLPVAGCAWNTVIAPPMALVGQKPASSRVDGFWVRQLNVKETETTAKCDRPITQKDIEMLVQWGQALLTTSQPYEKQYDDLQKQIDAQREIINDLRARQNHLVDEKRASVLSITDDPSLSEVTTYLRDQGFDVQRTSAAAGAIRSHLRELNTLSPVDIDRVLQLMVSYPPATVSHTEPLRAKTDPVKNSIQVIKDVKGGTPQP